MTMCSIMIHYATGIHKLKDLFQTIRDQYHDFENTPLYFYVLIMLFGLCHKIWL